MHPEVRSDKPGRCPKCGMVLVASSAMLDKPSPRGEDGGLGARTWQSYLPLFLIIAVILAGALAVSLRDYQRGAFVLANFIVYFMTGFFLVFAGFKLIDLRGFAHGYATYDLLAQRLFTYGYIYPFLELAFGLTMLAGLHPHALLWLEFAVMVFSGIGVAIKLARREPFTCACLGTFLKVPLTTITLIEDFGMAALALVLIFLT